MDLFERLDRELTSMAYTHGNTLLTIKRANRYFPKLIPILKKNGVPEDLIYLACIESTLNPRAYSPAKAAGLWQFIPSTGKEYGLEVNEFVDERYHPEKATQAACRYLKTHLPNMATGSLSPQATMPAWLVYPKNSTPKKQISLRPVSQRRDIALYIPSHRHEAHNGESEGIRIPHKL